MRKITTGGLWSNLLLTSKLEWFAQCLALDKSVGTPQQRQQKPVI